MSPRYSQGHNLNKTHFKIGNVIFYIKIEILGLYRVFDVPNQMRLSVKLKNVPKVFQMAAEIKDGCRFQEKNSYFKKIIDNKIISYYQFTFIQIAYKTRYIHIKIKIFFFGGQNRLKKGQNLHFVKITFIF